MAAEAIASKLAGSGLWRMVPAVLVAATLGAALAAQPAAVVAGLAALGALSWLLVGVYRDPSLAGTAFLGFVVLAPRLLYPFGSLAVRAMEMLTLCVAAASLARVMAGRASQPWRGLLPTALIWVIFLSLGLSMSSQVLLARVPLVFRDLFEFYRLPFYLFAFSIGAQIEWTTHRLWRRLLVPLLVLVAVVVAFCIVQRLFGTHEVVLRASLLFTDRAKAPVPSLRAIGTFESHNPLAQFLTIGGAVAAAVALFARTRLRWRIAATTVALLALIGIVSGLSRSGVLGAAAASLVLAAHVILRAGPRRALPRVVAVCAVTAVILIGTLKLAPRDFELMVVRTLRRPIASYAYRWRSALWSEQFERFSQHPLLGSGPCKFLLGRGAESVRFSDNSYVQECLTSGLVGLTLWLALMAALLGRAWRLSHEGTDPLIQAYGIGIQCAMVGLLVMAFATDVFSALKVMPIFLFLAGAMYGVALGDTPAAGRQQPAAAAPAG